MPEQLQDIPVSIDDGIVGLLGGLGFRFEFEILGSPDLSKYASARRMQVARFSLESSISIEGFEQRASEVTVT
jgi:hypothetical protein